MKRKGDSSALRGVLCLSEACPKTVSLMQTNGGLSKRWSIIWETRQVLTTCSIFVPATSELPFQGLKKEHRMKGRTGRGGMKQRRGDKEQISKQKDKSDGGKEREERGIRCKNGKKDT